MATVNSIKVPIWEGKMRRRKKILNVIGRALKAVAAATVILYATAIVGWDLAHRVIGDGFWLLGLANAVAVYLFVPLPAMAVLAGLARHRAAWIALLIVAWLFVGLFGAHLLPAGTTARASDGKPSLTVMTYNVLYTNTDAGPIAETIRRAEPDLIAFQELTTGLAQGLEQDLGQTYPYRTPLYPERCHAGVALWSRYPLTVEPVGDDVFCRVRPAMVELGGQTVRAIAMHGWPYTALDPASVERSFRWREQQAAYVLELIADQPEPVILLGDFNATPMHESYQILTQALDDAFLEAGWGLGHTFPATHGRFWDLPYPKQMVRIDHVFHSERWIAESAQVVPWDGQSDHLAVTAQLLIK